MAGGRRPGTLGFGYGDEPTYSHGPGRPNAGISTNGPLGSHHGQTAFIPRLGSDAPRNRASHEKIIDIAVGDFFTEEAQSQIVEGSVAQDGLRYQGTSPESTAAHGMKSASETNSQAVMLRDAKIAGDLSKTQKLILAGRVEEARETFGRLTHTIQDKYPHAHTAGADGRVPLVWNPLNARAVFLHAQSDSNEIMSGANVKAAIAETRACYVRLEAAVLNLDSLPSDGVRKPDSARYTAFLKFRGIVVTSQGQIDSYLRFDQGRWAEGRQGK